jgi:sporulation protein YtfJ
MSDHPIQGLMKTAMESLHGMVDVNTVIGDPVETPDGSVIVPVSRVAFGFAAGGGQYTQPSGPRIGERDNDAVLPFGGGSGAGVSVQPVGFLVVGQGQVRMLSVHGTQPLDRLIDMAPQLFDKIKAMAKNEHTHENSTGSDRQEYRTTMQ